MIRKTQIEINMSNVMKIKKLIVLICFLLLLVGSGHTVGNHKNATAKDISSEKLRKEVCRLLCLY